MIVDSSALVAIVTGEPERDALLTAALDARRCRISAATWLESAMVVDGRDDPVVSRRLDEIVRTLRIEVVPVTASHAAIARRAFTDFGKGRHPANLNFGDCFSYALASAENEPLLCKGNDFRQTDIEVVELANRGN